MGCSGLKIQEDDQFPNVENVVLAGLVEESSGSFSTSHRMIGIPNYDSPIKVNISYVRFNANTFKAYKAASDAQNLEVYETETDSLNPEPRFINVKLIDQIGVIQNLSKAENNGLYQYLLTNHNTEVVVEMSMAVPLDKLSELASSDEVFIESYGKNAMVLKGYKDSEIHIELKLSDAVKFAYQTAGFCWSEDDRHQLAIVALEYGQKKCPKSTHRNPNKVKTKVDYFKF